MNYKLKIAFVIMASILAVSESEQGLDCRKLVYSRNCRGVATKRDSLGSDEMQSNIAVENTNLNRLLNNHQLFDEGVSSPKKTVTHDERAENERHMDKLHLHKFLFTLLMGNKRRNIENENYSLYEY